MGTLVKLGSLCSGAGGLDLAVEKVFGAETVWHCEIDTAASKVLAHRWPGVPNHRDLITTDWAIVEPIDILCAGWPCQPWSAAGKQLGAADERAIWPHIAHAIRVLRPRYVCLENVSAVVVLGELARAAGDLAEAGYDAQWTCLSASEVGAPHKRERFFIVATDSAGDGRHEGRPESAGLVGRSDVALGGDAAVSLLPTPAAADGGAGSRLNLRTAVTLLPTPTASDGSGGKTSRSGDRIGEPLLGGIARDFAGQWGKYAPAIHRWEQIAGPAPSPTEPNRNGKPRLNPAFSEWLMGWPAGWVTEVPGLSRNDKLRIIGNGVVPQAAEAALSWLLSLEGVAA